jgi:hypothetical protein
MALGRYLVYADDRVLVAILNNRRDWELVQTQGWYRLPVRHAPPGTPDFDWLAFYFTRAFGDDGWAIHYYAPIGGHELVTRRDLFPEQPDHPRAGQWYFLLQLGSLQHKLPPILSRRWRRLTFIVTSGDRFMHAVDITDLLDAENTVGQPYVTLKENLFPAARRSRPYVT